VEPRANGIEAEGLVREFKGGIRAVDGIDLEVAPRQMPPHPAESAPPQQQSKSQNA
jgi:hypothetical protein